MNRFIPTPFTLDIIALIALVLSVWFIRKTLRNTELDMCQPKDRKVFRNCIAIASIGATLSVFTLLFSIGIYATGTARGMTMENWQDMRIDQILNTNAKTPKSEKLPAKTNGHIIILYKYGCPDCEAIQDDLEKAVKDIDLKNVHYVASSSDDGKRILEETHINDVPAVMYMRHEPLSNGATTTHMSAYRTEGNDVVVNEAALKRVKLLQDKKR